MHEMNIAHTDIKPENIVLVDDRVVHVRDIDERGTFIDKVYSLVKLYVMSVDDIYSPTQVVLKSPELRIIDIDNAVRMDVQRRYLVGSNRYRAPEVSAGEPSTLYLCSTHKLLVRTHLVPAS